MDGAYEGEFSDDERKAYAELALPAELYPRTFWNFAREFSSFRRQGAATGERR